MANTFRNIRLTTELEQWPLREPFRITGHTWETMDVLLVRLELDGKVGRGEGEGVYYKADQPATMQRQIEALRKNIEAQISRDALQTLLPPGGARNALDSALWDLEAKCSGQPAWAIAGLAHVKPLVTTFTCGADTPARMADAARGFTGAKAIKVKLTGEPIDRERILAIREAVPRAWLGVDGNQGFDRSSFRQLLPVLLDTRVQLIEQPFPIGEEHWLDDLDCPIALAADESLQTGADLPRLAGRFQVANIKLDKCGGLTEGLALAHAARERGLQVMVGNMLGTSLAMAPAFLLGQLCSVVDLDGPIYFREDRSVTVSYAGGEIMAPESLWGYPTTGW